MAGKNKGAADAAALQKLVDELREQLAAATAGTALAQLEAELAALKTDRDQVMADLADVSAKLELSIEERTKLAAALEDAQIESRNMRNAQGTPIAIAMVRAFDTSGTMLDRMGNTFTIKCDTPEIADRVADQLRSDPVPMPASVSFITGPAISVRTRSGRQQTRYRAGRAFGPEAVPLALADLSKDDLDALKGDPELVITDYKPSQEA